MKSPMRVFYFHQKSIPSAFCSLFYFFNFIMQRRLGNFFRRDQLNRNDPPTAPAAPTAPIAPIDPQGAVAGIGYLPQPDAAARRGHVARDANAVRRSVVAEGEIPALADDSDNARLPLEPGLNAADQQVAQVLPELTAAERRGHAALDAVVARRRLIAEGEEAALAAAVARGEAAARGKAAPWVDNTNCARLPLEPGLNGTGRQVEQALPELPDRGENQLARDGQANAAPAVAAARRKHISGYSNAVINRILAEGWAAVLADDTASKINSNHSSQTLKDSSQTETTPDRPVSPFSRLDFDEKIKTLLGGADNQINQAAAYDASFLNLVTTQIGSRNLTAKGCLEFSLEIALENRREQVPDISLRLVNILNANDQVVRLYGVDFPRARIEAWSKEESLPEPIQVRQEFVNKDGELGNRYGEDVHNQRVRAAGNKQLEVMGNRTPAGSKKTAEETDAEIRRYIATQPPSELAMAGFNRIMQRNGAGEIRGDSPRALATVWGYVEQCTNQEMKQNLRKAVFDKLAEIGDEFPCSTGVIQRIADIPTAIDLSLPQDIPEEEIFTELAKMAGDINASFEDDNAFNCSGAREEAGPDEDSPARMAVEAAISDLKRDMFLAKARVELVLLRNIDSNFVMAAAERVFPKGMVL